MSSGKWLILGEILVALGGAFVVAALTIALQSGDAGQFWTWPGITGLTIGFGGAICVVVGLVRRDDSRGRELTQRQKSGTQSTNLQAGRDIRTGDR
ncbi:hypothetical protein [Microbacterium capsulatum]|uniref:DUF2530 domain-containing protein n=1 Tax=Microbacterium capsulatum TaxID=3041921 RepID=A0ABU0XG29_9MICO|nr:hypothetical protein [Microbacterium sp. ASV81]MDQ4214076.1 hypothetical protein [Microbacterium sp. ASV81]